MTNDLPNVSKRIDRAAIRLYAEISDDFNPIHVDPEFAAASPMKGIIAHGMLSLNLIWQVLRAAGEIGPPIVLDVRFRKPVRENDVITAGGHQSSDDTYDVWAKNEQGETVIDGTARITLASATGR